jgi:PBP1b-binding outer membrane lipoprotein LpoB
MTMLKKLMTVAAMALLVGATACTAEVEDEGKAPSVEVKGGEMPEVDVDPANVEVSTDTQQVVTPEVNVTPANP